MISADMWTRTTKNDPDAVALANRHYSRLKYGKVGKMVGPPGRLLTLITQCKRAVWVTHWPYVELAMDGLDSWRCTMFRNEGAGLSSELIRGAMAATEAYWSEIPRDGWITWVDAAEIGSVNPGYCFKRAGWRHDPTWKSKRTKSALIRLRANGPTEGTFTPLAYADERERLPDEVVEMTNPDGSKWYLRRARFAEPPESP